MGAVTAVFKFLGAAFLAALFVVAVMVFLALLAVLL